MSERLRRPATLAVLALSLATLACQTVLGSGPPAARPTVTPAAAASPTSESAAPRLGLSRSRPFPAEAAAVLPNWTIEVLEVLRGEPAWQALAEANLFNDPAPEGQEYVLVRVAVRFEGSSTRSIAGTDFRLTGQRGIAYFKAYAVTPEPYLEAELRAGESAEGWSVYLAAQDETELLLMFDPIDFNDEAPPYFLALTPEARFEIDPELAGLAPTRLGADLREPAALGQTLVTEDWELEALEVRRGAEAWDMLLAANQFNDPPPDGLEYLLVRVRVRALHPDDEAVYISGSSYFQARADDGRLFDPPAVVVPEPGLDARLFPGGSYTGWVALQGPIDTRLNLEFNPFYALDETDQRFIALRGNSAP